MIVLGGRVAAPEGVVTPTMRGELPVGSPDELGAEAVTDRFHVKHLHATILNQLGFDPNRLSYRFAGLDQKLVGVEGARPIAQLIS